MVDRRSPRSTRPALAGARGVYIQNGVRHVGYVFAPQLNLDLRWPSATAADRWNFGFLVEVPFRPAPERILLRCAPPLATATRPEYRAPSGHGGWQVLAALSHRWDRWWLGAFIKYDDVSSAVFADSHSLPSGGKSAAALRSAMCLPNRPLGAAARILR